MRYDFVTKVSELSKMSPQLYAYLTNLLYKWSKCQFISEIEKKKSMQQQKYVGII